MEVRSEIQKPHCFPYGIQPREPQRKVLWMPAPETMRLLPRTQIVCANFIMKLLTVHIHTHQMQKGSQFNASSSLFLTPYTMRTQQCT